MAELTSRHALPLLQSGQAQKEITHNEAIAAIDVLLHLSVAGLTSGTPPVDPGIAVSWIVGPAPTGDWTGRAGMIATFDEAGWRYRTPPEGCFAWSVADGAHAVFRGGAWSAAAWPVRAIEVRGRKMLDAEPLAFPPVTGGSNIDVQARAAIDDIVNALRAMGIVAPLLSRSVVTSV